MPTYAYACTECDHRFEAVQSFSDDSLTVCPECGGRLRKVFNAVGIVFKGGGFYRTDSRSGSSAASGAGPSGGPGKSSSSDGGSAASTEKSGSSSETSGSPGSSSTGKPSTGSSAPAAPSTSSA